MTVEFCHTSKLVNDTNLSISYMINFYVTLITGLTFNIKKYIKFTILMNEIDAI